MIQFDLRIFFKWVGSTTNQTRMRNTSLIFRISLWPLPQLLGFVEVFVFTLYFCWWLKSCTTWDVWNPINNGIFTISTGAGCQPSTVVPWKNRHENPPFGFICLHVPSIKEATPNNKTTVFRGTLLQECFICFCGIFLSGRAQNPSSPLAPNLWNRPLYPEQPFKFGECF